MWTTGGAVGALTAMMSTVALILDRSKTEEAVNMLNGVRLLVATHIHMNFDRLAIGNEVVNQPLSN